MRLRCCSAVGRLPATSSPSPSTSSITRSMPPQPPLSCKAAAILPRPPRPLLHTCPPPSHLPTSFAPTLPHAPPCRPPTQVRPRADRRRALDSRAAQAAHRRAPTSPREEPRPTRRHRHFARHRRRSGRRAGWRGRRRGGRRGCFAPERAAHAASGSLDTARSPARRGVLPSQSAPCRCPLIASDCL